ncbi:MAG: hypothetical protein SOW03_00795 [Campylobacter sp.]|nr:hypothetical protein [Campylobacteraceae bacterium]MDY2634857.1 hypothetical protein [Campylobacter sp.]
MNEIASVALLPRNDGISAMTQGILEFPRVEILGSSPRMTKNASRGMTQGFGILAEF